MIKLAIIFFKKQVDFLNFQVNFITKTTVNALIFNKITKASPSGKDKKFSEAEVINFATNDADKIGWAFCGVSNLIGMPIQLLILFKILFDKVGIGAFGNIFAFLILCFLSYYLLKVFFIDFSKMMQFKDNRLKLTSETLNGLKNLKLNGWDEEFLNKILIERSEEVNFMDALLTNCNWRIFMGWASIPLMISITLGVKILLGGNIEIKLLLTVIIIVDQMKNCLDWFPPAFNLFTEALVGFRRITNYLNKTEIDPSYKTKIENNLAIKIKNGSFSWGRSEQCQQTQTNSSSLQQTDEFKIILEEIDLSVEKGKFVGVIGEVGAGKSSLLNACMNNLLLLSEGSVKVDGKLAYVSQNSWIQNKTLKDNILFYNELDEERYRKVLEVCELNKDIRLFEGGDQIEIGEKGVNLSGGQKARVSLARAVYSDADIFLLDDTISALDAHVGKNVMKNCFVKHLKGKTRMLVTHALHYLKYCDEVIYLDNGKIRWKGDFSNLQKQEFYKNLMEVPEKSSKTSLKSSKLVIPVGKESNKLSFNKK